VGARRRELQLAPTRAPMGAAAAGAHARPQPARRGARPRATSLPCAPASAEGAPTAEARTQRGRGREAEAACDARGEAARGAPRLRVTASREGGGWELGSRVREGNRVRVSGGLLIYILGCLN